MSRFFCRSLFDGGDWQEVEEESDQSREEQIFARRKLQRPTQPQQPFRREGKYDLASYLILLR
jgi:hypothetical protein